MKVSRNLAAVVTGLSWALLITLLLSSGVYGQLTLESIQPPDGAENVSTDLDIVFTFSQPLDTTAHFEDSGGFYVGVQIIPNPSEPEDPVLSPDRRTITVHFQAPDNTTYRVLVNGAESESGQLLDRPYVVTFSTGTLPTGSISGTVDFPGSGEAEGTMVLLLPDDFFASFVRVDDESESDDEGGLGFLGTTIVTDSDGHFTMKYVNEGLYVLAGIKDLDQDGIPTIGTPGEGIGFHDFDEDRVPNLVNVADGANLVDMNLTLTTPSHYTAATNFADATTLAVNRHADARFFSLGGRDLSTSGEGFIWVYGFHSPSTGDTLGTLTFFNSLYPLDRVAQGQVNDTDPMSPIEIDWVDSDVAVAAAEVAGGGNVRAGHPGSLIDAVLFNTDLLGGPTVSQAKLASRIPVWIIVYYDEQTSEALPIFVDAETGEVVTTDIASDEVPTSTLSAASYPNPFRSETTIQYTLPVPGTTVLTIYDVLGRLVRTLVNEWQPAGSFDARWDGTSDDGQPIPAGEYFYRLQTQKLILTGGATRIR